jgi:AcrR family transcriptional regulator
MAHEIETTERPDTHTRILVEAERLFRHYGYSKTTVADIARELGMSPANVYRFFPSKSAIVEAMADAILKAQLAKIAAVADGPGSASQRIRGILMLEHCHTTETLTCDPKVHEVVEIAMAEQWHIILEHIHALDAVFTRLVTEGVASGEFPQQNARLSGRCINQSFVSWKHPSLIATCGSDPAVASPEDLADFILDAVRGRRAP